MYFKRLLNSECLFEGTKNLLLWSLGVMLTVYILDNYLFGFGQVPVLDG